MMMNKPAICLKDWLQIHPYAVAQPSDGYFIRLANRLYETCLLDELPVPFRKKLSLYAAAYLEDLVSGLGLWSSFTAEHCRLYGRALPFYETGAEYAAGEPNWQDLCFIVWNTWQKALYPHPYVDPSHPLIMQQAGEFLRLLDEAYEEAPENETLRGYFDGFAGAAEAGHKLEWLFGRSYLTEPSMQPYIGSVAPSDRFIVPTGPLALFLHEWVGLLSGNEAWRSVKGLFASEPALPEEMREKNREMYRNFTAGTGGKDMVFLNGYAELRRFLTGVLGWPDDENHTLPQMKAHKNFVLMAEPAKGILLAKDICEYIAHGDNPCYDRVAAERGAFRLLTEETLCPPDLLVRCIRDGLLPDACLPGGEGKELVRRNADFIARHSLLYYYRGD